MKRNPTQKNDCWASCLSANLRIFYINNFASQLICVICGLISIKPLCPLCPLCLCASVVIFKKSADQIMVVLAENKF